MVVNRLKKTAKKASMKRGAKTGTGAEKPAKAPAKGCCLESIRNFHHDIRSPSKRSFHIQQEDDSSSKEGSNGQED